MLKSGIYDFIICHGGTGMCFVLGFGRKRPDLKQYRISGLTTANSNEPIEEEEHVVDPNNISTSDAETEDGAEPEKDTEKNDPPEVREEEAPDKHKKYTREDFLARRHGKEREPWVQKSMPFLGKSLKTKEEEHYN